MTIELSLKDFDKEGWPTVKLIHQIRLTEWKNEKLPKQYIRVQTLVDVMRRPVYEATWRGTPYLIDTVTGQLYDENGKCLSSDQLKKVA